MMLCLALDAESTSNVRMKSLNHYLLCVSENFVCCLDGFDAALQLQPAYLHRMSCQKCGMNLDVSHVCVYQSAENIAVLC